MALSEAENGCSVDDGGESDASVKSCVLGGFSDTEETRGLISSLLEVHGNTSTTESTTERFLGETAIHRVQEPLNKHFLISALAGWF